MKPRRTAAIYPSADEINALGRSFAASFTIWRRAASGDVQTIAILSEDRVALQRRVGELEAELDRLR